MTRKNIKSILSLLLSICLVISSSSISGFASNTETSTDNNHKQISSESIISEKSEAAEMTVSSSDEISKSLENTISDNDTLPVETVSGNDEKLADISTGEEETGEDYRADSSYTSTYPSDWAAPTVSNLIIFVGFSDSHGGTSHVSNHTGVLASGNCALSCATTLSCFNGTAENKQGMQRYLYNISYGQLRVDNIMPQYDASSGKIEPLILSGTEAEYSRTGNYEGKMLSEIIDYINTNSLVPSSVKLDRITEDVLDNLTIVVLTDNGDTNSSYTYSYKSSLGSKKINGKTVGNYNILPEESIYFSLGGAGTIAHEFLHSMGYPDLYRSNSSSDVSSGIPVYRWCIMSACDYRMLYPLAYLRSAYGGWFDIATVTEDTSNITLYPASKTTELTKDSQAVILKTPYSDTEFFVVEYRYKSTNIKDYDSSLPGSGLIVYRVNTAQSTNKLGPPDMIYVFRPGDSYKSTGGEAGLFSGLGQSYLSSESGRTSYGAADLTKRLSDNAITYSDGQNSGIVISNVGLAGESISFSISFNEEIVNVDHWQNEAIQSNGSTQLISAVDDTNNIIYNLELPSKALYRFDETGYTKISTAALPTPGYSTAVSVYDNNVYAAYVTDSYVYLSKFSNGTWSNIYSKSIAANEVTLTSGSDGLYLAYTYSDSGNYNSFNIDIVKYSSGTSTALGTIHENGMMFGNPDIAVDGTTPYISYRNASGNTIYIKTLANGNWVNISEDAIVAGYTDLVVSNHVLYLMTLKSYDSGNNRIYYFNSETGKWVAIGEDYSSLNVSDVSLQIVEGVPYAVFSINGESIGAVYYSNGEWKKLGNYLSEANYGMNSFSMNGKIYVTYLTTSAQSSTKIYSAGLKNNGTAPVPGDIEPDKCSVTFNLLGGSFPVNSVLVYEITKGNSLILENGEYTPEFYYSLYESVLSELETPVKDGYTFAGWFTSENDTEEFDFRSEITENTTIYAHWNVSETPPENPNPPEEDWGELTTEDRLLYSSPSEIPEAIWIAGVTDREYTGKKITFPSLRVYDGKKLLKNRKDYTVSYKNNTNANDASVLSKAPSVVIAGKGNYTKKCVFTFKILPLDISAESFTANDLLYKYTGRKILGVPALVSRIEGSLGKLKNKTDFVCIYEKTNSNAADYDSNAFLQPNLDSYPYTITLKGIGNYTGTRTVCETIVPGDYTLVSSLKFSVGKAGYTGAACKPVLTVKKGTKTLKGLPEEEFETASDETKASTDYTYRFTDNICVGTGHAIITGRNLYVGTKTLNFTISGTSMKKVKLSGFVSSYPYNEGTPVTQSSATLYTVTGSGNSAVRHYLTPDNGDGTGDYTIAYTGNIRPGKATVIYRGINGYTGLITKTFTISGGISMKSVTAVGIKNYVYNGSAIEQSFATVCEGNLPEENTGVYLYYSAKTNGTACKIPMLPGTDYEVSYSPNIKAGKVTVSFTGKGKFTGTLKKNFNILAYKLTADAYTYPDGTAGFIKVRTESGDVFPLTYPYHKNGSTPAVVVTYEHWEGIAEGAPTGECLYSEVLTTSSYTLSYKNNKAYTEGTTRPAPTIVIKGKGNFTGTREKETFIISKRIIADGVTMVASDKVYSAKKNNYKTSVKLTDSNKKVLKSGTDYNVTGYSYEEETALANGTIRAANSTVLSGDIVPAGTLLRIHITGKNNYTGTFSCTFRVVKCSISKAKATVSSQDYIGSKLCPDKTQVKLTYNRRTLNDADYEIVSYSSNLNAGTGKIMIKGVGNYGGTKTISFSIRKRKVNIFSLFNWGNL